MRNALDPDSSLKWRSLHVCSYRHIVMRRFDIGRQPEVRVRNSFCRHTDWLWLAVCYVRAESESSQWSRSEETRELRSLICMTKAWHAQVSARTKPHAYIEWKTANNNWLWKNNTVTWALRFLNLHSITHHDLVDKLLKFWCTMLSWSIRLSNGIRWSPIPMFRNAAYLWSQCCQACRVLTCLSPTLRPRLRCLAFGKRIQ